MRIIVACIVAVIVSHLVACAAPESIGEAMAEYGTGGAEPLGCVTGPECPSDPNPCVVAACEWDGSCGAYPMPAGAVCPAGVCDGEGACVEAGPPCEPGPPYPVPECDGPGLTGVCFLYSHTCERD